MIEVVEFLRGQRDLVARVCAGSRRRPTHLHSKAGLRLDPEF